MDYKLTELQSEADVINLKVYFSHFNLTIPVKVFLKFKNTNTSNV